MVSARLSTGGSDEGRAPLPPLGRLGAVVGVALVARLAYWLLATPRYVPYSDAEHYYGIARNVAEGKGLSFSFPQSEIHPTAFRPPLYPTLLGGLFRVFGASITLGRIVSLVLGLAVVGLTMLVVHELTGDRRAVLAGGLATALFPPLIVNDVVLLTEPLSLVLLLATVLLLLRDRPAWAGLAAGLLVLSRTSAQFVLPLLVLWALWRVGWRRALACAAVAVLVIVPWIVRNQIQLGTPTLATSNGFNLAALYSEPARRAGGFVDAVRDPAFDRFRLYQYDEAAWDRALREDAIAQIRAHPRQLLVVSSRNVTGLLELDSGANRGAEFLDGRNLDVRRWFVPLVPVMALAGTAGLVRRRRHPGVVLLAGLGAYFFLTSAFTVAAPRLRAPVDLVWCIGLALLVARSRPDAAAVAPADGPAAEAPVPAGRSAPAGRSVPATGVSGRTPSRREEATTTASS